MTNTQAATPGKAAKGNGTTPPPPPPVSDQEEPPKKKGLTLEGLRKATSAGNTIPAAGIVTTAVVIDVRKPAKGAPFMAHPSPDFSLIGHTLSVKPPSGVGEAIYLLDPDIAAIIPRHVRLMRFSLCFDAWQRQPFIWHIGVEAEGGRANSWISSAMRIWGAAKERWVCCIAAGGAYELHEPLVPIKGEPVWPNKTFEELMMMGFRDLYIDEGDHPEVVKRLTTLIPE